MKVTYPSKSIEEENERLGAIICNSDDGISVDEIIEKYASDEYKKYIKEREKERQRLWDEEGIIVE